MAPHSRPMGDRPPWKLQHVHHGGSSRRLPSVFLSVLVYEPTGPTDIRPWEHAIVTSGAVVAAHQEKPRHDGSPRHDCDETHGYDAEQCSYRRPSNAVKELAQDDRSHNPSRSQPKHRMPSSPGGEVQTVCRPSVVPKEGFEPTHPCGQRILSPPRLPFRHFGEAGAWREEQWSGRGDSNPRPSPWQGDALPLSHFRSDGLIIGSGEMAGQARSLRRLLGALQYHGPRQPAR